MGVYIRCVIWNEKYVYIRVILYTLYVELFSDTTFIQNELNTLLKQIFKTYIINYTKIPARFNLQAQNDVDNKNKEIPRGCNGHRIHSNRPPYIFTDVHFAPSSYNYAKYAKPYLLFSFYEFLFPSYHIDI